MQENAMGLVKRLLIIAAVATPHAAVANTFPEKTISKTLVAGKKFRLDYIYSLNPDCSVRGYAEIRLIAGPSHGSLSLRNGKGYPNTPTTSQYADCNTRAVPVREIWYDPAPGFVGSDVVRIEAIFPTGNAQAVHYNITVK